MVVFAVGGAGDRRRRVGEFLLCSDTWELLYIMRDDLSLYSRGIIHILSYVHIHVHYFRKIQSDLDLVLSADSSIRVLHHGVLRERLSSPTLISPWW